MIGEFKKALKSDWLFCFTVPFSVAEKKMDEKMDQNGFNKD